jgi:hypothetical protein
MCGWGCFGGVIFVGGWFVGDRRETGSVIVEM